MAASKSRATGLRLGDRVAVVATGFAALPERLHSGVEAIRAMGFVPLLGRHVGAVDGYLAGTDDDRAGDLVRAIEDASVRGIWFARGGYGTTRLLERIDWAAVAKRPRVWVGYSDLTAFFAALGRKAGQVGLHGPMVTELGDARAYHRPSLRAALAGRPVAVRFRRSQVLVPGRASGALAGGNLVMVSHLLGTPWAPEFRDAVIALEEKGEEAYRIDRLLTHLRSAGVFRRAAAVLVGNIAAPASERIFPPDRAIDHVLRDRLGDLGVPVVTGLPFGHVDGMWTLPIGGQVRLDTARGDVRFDPAPAPGLRRRA